MNIKNRIILTLTSCFVGITMLSCASSLVMTLPEQQLANFENQTPSLVASAKKQISGAGSARAQISKSVLLAPIVHAFYFDYKIGANQDMPFYPYWLNRNSPVHLRSEMHDNALQYVVDWTAGYVAEDLEKKGFDVYQSHHAVKKNSALETAGSAPASTKVWSNVLRDPNGFLVKGYGEVFGEQKYKDWSNIPFNDFRPNDNYGAVVFVNSSAKWEYKGHARIDDGAIVIFDVHHWLEVKVCTNSFQSDCKTTRIPKDGGDVVSTLFIPALKGQEEDKLKERSTQAIKMAAQHSADLILTALDSMIVKQ